VGRDIGPYPVMAAMPDMRAEKGLNEKMVHRALADDRSRPGPAPMSEQARNRLYARMFPADICNNSHRKDEPDPAR